MEEEDRSFLAQEVEAAFEITLLQNITDKLPSRCNAVLSSPVATSGRRQVFFSTASFATILTLNCIFTPLRVRAEEKPQEEEKDDEGVLGGIKSFFNPNERTKSGKILPKGYLKSARELVKTLRDLVQEDPKDNAKFRWTADAAKESIKEYLSDWRGQEEVVRELSCGTLAAGLSNDSYDPVNKKDLESFDVIRV